MSAWRRGACGAFSHKRKSGPCVPAKFIEFLVPAELSVRTSSFDAHSPLSLGCSHFTSGESEDQKDSGQIDLNLFQGHPPGAGELGSEPTSPQLQVLRDVLLPGDAGHGRRLWWEGGSVEDTEGHPGDDPYRPLLLLLPLLPPNQDHQVRWEGEAAWRADWPLLHSLKSLCWLSQSCFKPHGIRLV